MPGRRQQREAHNELQSQARRHAIFALVVSQKFVERHFFLTRSPCTFGADVFFPRHSVHTNDTMSCDDEIEQALAELEVAPALPVPTILPSPPAVAAVPALKEQPRASDSLTPLEEGARLLSLGRGAMRMLDHATAYKHIERASDV